jgi:hypothetical protein
MSALLDLHQFSAAGLANPRSSALLLAFTHAEFATVSASPSLLPPYFRWIFAGCKSDSFRICFLGV